MTDENFSLKEEVRKLRTERHTHNNELNTIKCRTEVMDDRLQKLETLPTDVAVLMVQVKDWMENTKEYRDSLNQSIKTITGSVTGLAEKISSLPCDKSNEKHKGHRAIILLIWGALAILFTLLANHMGWKL